MKRLRRIISVLLLLLAVALAVLWKRSYSWWDAIYWHRGDHYFELLSGDGIAVFQRATLTQPSWRKGHWTQAPEHTDWRRVPTDMIGVVTWEMMFWDRYWWYPKPLVQLGDFVVYRTAGCDLPFASSPPKPGCWAVQVPYWLLIAIVIVLPVMSFAVLVVRRARKRGAMDYRQNEGPKT